MLSVLSLRGARSAPGPSLVFAQALVSLVASQAPRPPYIAPSAIRPILRPRIRAILLPDAGDGGRVSQVAPGGTAAGGRYPILRS